MNASQDKITTQAPAKINPQKQLSESIIREETSKASNKQLSQFQVTNSSQTELQNHDKDVDNNSASRNAVARPMTAISSKILQQNLPKKPIRPTTAIHPKSNITQPLATSGHSSQKKMGESTILKKEMQPRLIQGEEEEEEEKEGFQNQKEEKISTLGQLESSSSKLTRPFFQITNNSITLKIANFLAIEDLIKLATLSKQARNFVATTLQQIDYSKEMEDFSIIYYNPEICTVREYQQIQEDYHSFLKEDLSNLDKKFLMFLRKRNQNQNQILEILKAGINYNNNKIQNKIDIIPYIKTKGLLNCFSDINRPFISPSDLQVELPTNFYCFASSGCEQFIYIVKKYVSLKKENKSSIQLQRQALKLIQQNKVRSQFMKGKVKLIKMYSKPVTRFKKDSKIFDYINKNTIANIMKFLTIQEIAALYQSGKTIREIVHQILENQLSYLQKQREDKLLALNLPPQFGDGILYLRQFKQFEGDELPYMARKLSTVGPLSEQFQAIYFAVSSKTQKEVITTLQNDPNIICNINLYQQIPNPEKLQLINSFLEKYPTLKEFKQKRFKKIQQIFQRECTLLYQVMKGYQKLDQFRCALSSFEKVNQDYSSIISPLDKTLFNYLRLLRKNDDEILMVPSLSSVQVSVTYDGDEYLQFPN